jgi:ABC-type transport system substrate-binding protein
MRRWQALWFGASLALCVAACGSGGGSSSGPPPHNNFLIAAAPGEPDTMDPGGGISGFDAEMTDPIYDTLIKADPKTQELQPDLALSWGFMGADKLTFRLNLRHNVKFHDGTPFDAQAVKTSIEHYQAGKQWFDLTPVSSIDVVDPYTADLHLSAPYSPLPAILTFRGGQIISPAALQKWGKDYGRHPVGTGPFMFQSWEPGAEVDELKFPGYWGAAPKLAGIKFKVIPTSTSMATAAEGGQVDFATALNTTNLPALRANSKLNVQVLNTLSLAIVTTNNLAPPFNNPLVRRAVNMLVDRRALSDAVNGRGVGQGPAWQFVPPTYWPFSKDLKNYPRDPAQAKSLLAQAGYPNGLTVQLCNPTSQDTTAAQIEKANLAEGGITVNISVEPVNSCLSKMFNATVPMVQIGWLGLASPYQTYSTMFGPGNPFGKYDDVNQLLLKVAGVYTQPEQQAVYQQINQALFQDAPSIPLYYLVNVASSSKRVQGLVSNPQGAVLLRNAYFQ